MLLSYPIEVRRLASQTFGVWSDNETFTLAGIKDPSVVKLPDGKYLIFASIGDSINERWRIGRFTADHLTGPWTEIPMAKVSGLEGWDICAPDVYLRHGKNGRLEYHMVVQNLCFHENGIIAHAISYDGENFVADEKCLMDRHIMAEAGYNVIAVYDPGYSEIKYQGRMYECVTFTGIRKVGCGDLYMTMREMGKEEAEWETPCLLMRQEDVPFHNKPHDQDNFEWGLEAAKVIQLDDDTFMLMGVAFLEGDKSQIGTRQVLFCAYSSSPRSPYTNAQPLIEPLQNRTAKGEHGHGDAVDFGESLVFVFQRRSGNIKAPDLPRLPDNSIEPTFHWHPYYAQADKGVLLARGRAPLCTA